MDATTKTGRSMIDEAIDKAMKIKADAMKKIEDILDTFIADEISFYLLEGSVDLNVYHNFDSDGVVLSFEQGDENIAVLKVEDFPAEVTCIYFWHNYLKVAVRSLNSRTERIEFTDYCDEYRFGYCLRLK